MITIMTIVLLIVLGFLLLASIHVRFSLFQKNKTNKKSHCEECSNKCGCHYYNEDKDSKDDITVDDMEEYARPYNYDDEYPYDREEEDYYDENETM